MKKTTRNILIIVAAVVAAIGIVLAIVLPITLRPADERYTVTFNSNGGTAVDSITDIERNSTISEPAAPTRDGYTFKGWYSDAKLTKEWNFETDKVKGNMTLYAKWEYNATSGLSMLPNNGESYTITGLGDATDVTDIVIPSTYNNLPVTIIAADAFANVSTITSVYVPASVTAVRDRAFINCPNLKWVNIAGNAELGARLFEDCSKLERVTLPNNLTEIKSLTFKSCVSLTDVNISSSVTAIGEQAFYGCKKLASVNFPSGLTTIEKEAFSACESLTEVKLPATVSTLGQNVFSGCSGIERLSVESSNSGAYYSQGNCIIAVSVDKNEYVRTVVVGCKNSVIPSDVTVIGEGAFYGCKMLNNARIIHDKITTIGAHAFASCESLERIVIPASVTRIEEGAFTGCYVLNIVEFSDQAKLNSIGREAFSYCNISGFTIPQSVTVIGLGAFYSCPGNINVRYRGTKDQLDAMRIGETGDYDEDNLFDGWLTISCTDGSGEKTFTKLIGRD